MATLLAQLCHDSCCYGNCIDGLIHPIVYKKSQGKNVSYTANCTIHNCCND